MQTLALEMPAMGMQASQGHENLSFDFLPGQAWSFQFGSQSAALKNVRGSQCSESLWVGGHHVGALPMGCRTQPPGLGVGQHSSPGMGPTGACFLTTGWSFRVERQPQKGLQW